MPEWTDDRRSELNELNELLRAAASINDGSHALEKIERCIQIARKLTKTDIAGCRDSFFSFLCAEATGRSEP